VKRAIRFLVPSVALLLVWGCAAGGLGSPQSRDVRVDVINDLGPRSALTVRVGSADTGLRNILGNVSPGSTRTFWFGIRGSVGTYQLTAEAADGRQIISRSFQVGVGDRVEWSVQRNSIELGRQTPSLD
jgi:hypothetical protein